MKLGLLAVAAAVAIHLILGLLQATGPLPADGRWFNDRARRELWEDALAQRRISGIRFQVRRWLLSPEPEARALELRNSLDEAYYGLSAKLGRHRSLHPDPITGSRTAIWLPPMTGAMSRWDGAYASLWRALDAFIKESGTASLHVAREACQEADDALEEIRERLSR